MDDPAPQGRPPPMPTWVKVMGLLALAAVAAFFALHLAGVSVRH